MCCWHLLCRSWLCQDSASPVQVPQPGGFPGVAVVNNPHAMPEMQEAQAWSLGWEDSLEKRVATHSSIRAWRIPWTEEPGELHSMGSQRVRLDWASEHITCPSHSACRHGVPGCNQTQVAKLRALYVLTVQGLGRVDNPVSSGEVDLYSGWELQLHVPARNSSPPPGLPLKSSILRSSTHPPRPDDFVVQSFPAPGSFPVSQIFASGIGQSIGASASASVLPMNILCWFPLRLTGLISLLYTVVYICQSQSPNSSHPSPFSLGIHTFVFYVYSALFLMPFYVNSLFWSTQLLLWVGRSSPPDRPGSKGSHSQRLSPSGSVCVWIWNQVPPPFFQDPPLNHSQKDSPLQGKSFGVSRKSWARSLCPSAASDLGEVAQPTLYHGNGKRWPHFLRQKANMNLLYDLGSTGWICYYHRHCDSQHIKGTAIISCYC